MTLRLEPRECPNCGSTCIIPTHYGLPDVRTWEKNIAGDLKFGGRCILPGGPNWHCRLCRHEWLVTPGPFDRNKSESFQRK